MIVNYRLIMISEIFCQGTHNEMVRSVLKRSSTFNVTQSPLVSTVLENTNIVWSPGQGRTFTLQLELTVPEQLITYPLQKSEI